VNVRPLRSLAALSLTALACGDAANTTAEPATGDPIGSTSQAPPGSTGGSPTTSTTDDPGVTTGGPGSSGAVMPPDACEGEPPLVSSGLAFDGASHVAMGPAPQLGLSTFTLEAWVRRDGRGRAAGTGVGGLTLVPLISKGRGESDGSNVDCNYAFGFFGDVLGADFEDMATGANHPIVGKTAVPLGRWHHVAATYDGEAWRLYLDGVLDAEAIADATPRHDSIQHFGLGAAFNSEGEPAGGLHGALDEVRVYARALTANELRATMYSTAPVAQDLVGHWHLDAGDASDAVGPAPGTIDGAVAIDPAAVLDRGAAPTVTDPQATDAGPDARTLTVAVADPEGGPVTVEFFARPLTPADDFTVVALPDTQYYTRDANPPERPDPDDPELFNAQTRWAWDNRADRNVVGLLTLGDIINNADQQPQWKRASAAFSILEDFSDPAWPDGLPFAASFGNHDQYPKDEPNATDEANTHLGTGRFAGRSYYGGNYDGDNDENYVYFRSGDLTIVAVNFQFNPAPSAAVLAWARRVFAAHPNALGVVTSHYIVTSGGGFSEQGKAIYDALKDVPNVQLMASGHVAQAARRSDEFGGHVIHSMLSDFQRSAPDPNNPEQPVVVEQSQTNGGQGYMRIWNFTPSRQELYVETYSPRKDAAYTDEQNEFALPVKLLGAGRSPFASLGAVEAEGGTAQIELPGVAAGTVFEWYAVARDCSHSTATTLQQIDRSQR
jgi:hypothetical protein